MEAMKEDLRKMNAEEVSMDMEMLSFDVAPQLPVGF